MAVSLLLLGALRRGGVQAVGPGALQVLLANRPAALCQALAGLQPCSASPQQQLPASFHDAAGVRMPAAPSTSSALRHLNHPRQLWQQQRHQQQRHQQQRRASTSSLRGELGSGSALGDVAGGGGGDGSSSQDASSASTAQRRESLLAGSGARFYETVRVQPCTTGYQLLLLKNALKTPAGNVLVLPTYSLALAVAAEWEWLPTGKPAPHQMPLSGLACTAIDQPRERAKVMEHLLKYVHTDAACIRYEPGPLERRQAATFDPLLLWAREQLGWRLATTHSISGTTQPPGTVAAVEAYLNGLDAWRLAAADQLTTSSKSLVLAAALLHGRLDVAAAVAAARLEEDFQLEDWGMVEAGHDLDIADTRTRLGAAAVFARLLPPPALGHE